MPEHLLFSEHMTPHPCDGPIKETFLGQAHIAGTGPEGTTCRECVFWHKHKHTKDGPAPCGPGWQGKRHTTRPLELKKAWCNRPIINKAERLIPHSAKSYRLFIAAEHPLPIKRSDQ